MLYLFLAILLFTLATLLSAGASRRADFGFVSLIVQTFAVIVPLLLIGPKFVGKIQDVNKLALLLAALAGLAIGFYALTFNKSLSIDKVGVVVPVIYGGTILLATLLSYFIFKETLKGLELVGLLLILVGLGFMIYARSVA